MTSPTDAPGDAALIARLRRMAEQAELTGALCCQAGPHDPRTCRDKCEKVLNAAVDALTGLQARVSALEQQIQEKDDLARSPSVGCASATGSPRSPQPEGDQR